MLHDAARTEGQWLLPGREKSLILSFTQVDCESQSGLHPFQGEGNRAASRVGAPHDMTGCELQSCTEGPGF